MDIKGLVLFSRDFGYCKITDHSGQFVSVRFIGTNRDARYSAHAIVSEEDFSWRPMPVGLQCRTLEGRIGTIVDAAFQPSETHGAHEYVLAYDGDAGETARLSERDLWPIPGSLSETPLNLITSLQADSLAHFRAREAFLAALAQVDRETVGIRALASSRISLLPHQAFVIGSVIDDPSWRYILADEVGLGKTIEAGVIAHQLLSQRPEARVLILCPGPLARQWLCELYRSFTGRRFRLVDLYEPASVSLEHWPLVISSLKRACRDHRDSILDASWDLVIVDEAHQLLWNSAHYGIVEQLAWQVPRMLLLSAIPARERDAELLQLLRLIEPKQYRDGGPAASKFSSLYAAQNSIGRRLRIVARQLDKPEHLDLEQLNADVGRLLSSDVVRHDHELAACQSEINCLDAPEDVIQGYRQLLEELISRYRISRRILKNRRSQLIDAGALSKVTRHVELISYVPSVLESEIEAVMRDLLLSLTGTSHQRALHVFFRKIAQALCDAVAIYEIARALNASLDASGKHPGDFDANAALDYDEHEAVIDAVTDIFAPEMDETGLKRLISLLESAIEYSNHTRIEALKTCLRRLLEDGANKIVVFAGTPGTASYLEAVLSSEFGYDAVSAFLHGLEDTDKELQVARFRNNPSCTILVSDESGGEGRNFQFAEALIHYDLPWSVSAIEQRIGRLDRIGRDSPVRSFVICPEKGLEASWFRCLHEGFGVFDRSISGLEFMLHASEEAVVKMALEGGPGGLIDMIPVIRESSETERATDDAEALTDAASFRRKVRNVGLRDSSGDQSLEAAVPRYLRAISRNRAARKVTDNKDPNLRIWMFSPEEVTNFRLVGLERQGDNPLQNRVGTFSRPIARDRPDLEFFCVGHPLVDALAKAARDYVRGRSLIARIRTHVQLPDLVLVAKWRVFIASDDDSSHMPELALRLLAGRVVWTGVDFETEEALEMAKVRSLLGELLCETGPAQDLDHKEAVETFLPEAGIWSATLNQLVKNSAALAEHIYRDEFASGDVAFCEEMLTDADSVGRVRSDEGPEYKERLLAAVDAVRTAELELDALVLVRVERVPHK